MATSNKSTIFLLSLWNLVKIIICWIDSVATLSAWLAKNVDFLLKGKIWAWELFFTHPLSLRKKRGCVTYCPLFSIIVGIESKGIWFYLPIGLLLLVNAIMFGLTIKEVYILDRELKDLGIITSDKPSRQKSRFILFAKLFLAMGLAWIFEIIGGLLGIFFLQSFLKIFCIFKKIDIFS